MASNVVAVNAVSKKATVRGRASPRTASTATPFTPWVVEGQETQVVVRNTFVQCILPSPPGASIRSKSSPAKFEAKLEAPQTESRPNTEAAGRKRRGTRVTQRTREASTAEMRKQPEVAEQRPGARRGRWWEESSEICAVSGFPICLLPYPPFRLKVRSGDCYVDGQFLAAKMIAERKFEVNGTPLSQSNLDALDSYISRCKLPKALMISDAKEEHAESASCKAKRCAGTRQGFATAKLQTLQEIQAARIAKIRKTGAAISKQVTAQTIAAQHPVPPTATAMQVYVPVRVPFVMSGGLNLTAYHPGMLLS